jgi:hypothetical protein
MNRILIALCATSMLVAFSTAASATTVDFTASGFTDVFDPVAGPFDPLSGNFSYDFDTSLNALTLTGFSLDVGATHYGIADVTSTYLTLGSELSIYGNAVTRTPSR